MYHVSPLDLPCEENCVMVGYTGSLLQRKKQYYLHHLMHSKFQIQCEKDPEMKRTVSASQFIQPLKISISKIDQDKAFNCMFLALLKSFHRFAQLGCVPSSLL